MLPKKTFWDDRFQAQVELLQEGPKKRWAYYIPFGSGRPVRDTPISTDDLINLHFILESDLTLDQLCETL
jgi:hypothetical protein